MNRHERRRVVALKRIMPQINKKNKINKNLTETKALGRIAKQKHIDEVKARTEKRKLLKINHK